MMMIVGDNKDKDNKDDYDDCADGNVYTNDFLMMIFWISKWWLVNLNEPIRRCDSIY